jgi:penicillin amidase
MLYPLKIILFLFVLITVAAGGGVTFLFLRAAPHYAGHIAMPGLTAPVDVYRDEHGIPHIFAPTMNDAAHALGYIHADERLFQMEMQRRAGQGRLSEILGADMLDVDKFIRTLGLYPLAQESFGTLSPETQSFFQAYADGVNLWLQTHRRALPPEFLLLGLTPEPWVPADSIVWGKLMALQLSGNYKAELLRAQLAQKLSSEQLRQLFPLPPADAPVTVLPRVTKMGGIQNLPVDKFNAPPAKTKDSLAQALVYASSPQVGRSAILSALDKLGLITGLARAASNEWVISGARTATGKPILANDPHLGLEAPVLWYLARIKTPELSLEGATVPGLPVVLLGQNEHIAWGFTTTGSDVQDLFAETIDPQNPTQYLVPGGAQPFETRTEIIHVKDAPDVTLTARATLHGPVLSDIDPDLAALAGPGHAMALAFTALGANDTTSEALVDINRSRDWNEFLEALNFYRAPPQNIVYADTQGHIGFIAAGLVPIRKKGDGSMPIDGATGADDWIAFVPFKDWPQVYDPPAGFVFNANNAIVPLNSPFYYGEDWEEPFRAERLQQFFDTISTHDLETSMKMQADIASIAAKQLLPYLLRQTFTDARAAQAFEMLRGWDGTMDQKRPEPLIFEAWMYEMHTLLLTDKAGNPLKASGPFDVQAMLSVLAAPGDWCGAQDPDCGAVIRQAFTDAIVLLTAREGRYMPKWRWGDEQLTVLRNKFWSHIPLLKLFSDLSVPSGGDFYTLDRGGSSVTDPDHPFARTHGPGFRGIYDLSDPAKSRFMIATGESGHIFSHHYGDLVKPWNDGQSITLTGTEDELKARRLPELIFVPAQP